jgi:hypothetical protein
VPQDISRDDKAKARTRLYDAPADTEWERKDHEYDADKTVQRKVLGKVVREKPYEHEKGHTYEAVVTCPDCGDQILISTDQEPGESTETSEA